MKIHPDSLEGVRLEPQTQATKPKPPQEAFGSVLDEEVAKVSGETRPQAAAPPPGVGALNFLLRPEAAQAVQSVSPVENEIMDQMDAVLSKWEEYAAKLDTPKDSPGLKQAYRVLGDIQGQVQDIKGRWPDMAANHPGLSGVLNELEVLSRTEEFKFNRGDYN